MTDLSARQPSATTPDRRHAGIAGWLRFFIVLHLYVMPAVFAVFYIVSWTGLIDQVPLLEFLRLPAKMLAAYTLFDIAFVAWGAVVAWQLKRRVDSAVLMAKVWVIASVLALLAWWGVLSLVGYELHNLTPPRPQLLSLVWLAYFTFSRRVRATYPEPGASVGEGK